MPGLFRVGVSPALVRPEWSDGLAGLGLERLASSRGIEWRALRSGHLAVPGDLAGLDAVVLENMDLRASSLAGVERLAMVARYGVGYDSVDVDACTERGIVVTNAPDGVRRPMATVNLALLLATSMRLVQKDRLVREGRWEDGQLLGSGLTGRTLGLIGMGNVGTETLRLAQPLDMRVLVHDPFAAAERIRATGAQPADLDALLTESDYVMLGVPLTPATRHLIGARELALMRPTACLINTARGAVVDEQALVEALQSGGIAGAALDVFEQEPVDAANPLLAMENVIVSPHSLGSTDECFLTIGQSVTESILDFVDGREPRHIVNRDVLKQPAVRARFDDVAATPAATQASESA